MRKFLLLFFAFLLSLPVVADARQVVKKDSFTVKSKGKGRTEAGSCQHAKKVLVLKIDKRIGRLKARHVHASSPKRQYVSFNYEMLWDRTYRCKSRFSKSKKRFYSTARVKVRTRATFNKH